VNLSHFAVGRLVVPEWFVTSSSAQCWCDRLIWPAAGASALAPAGIAGEPVVQSPQPVVDGPDERPGDRLSRVQLAVLDDRGEQAADGVRAGKLVGPGPQQFGDRPFGGSRGRLGVDRHPPLPGPAAGQDVVVVQVGVDQAADRLAGQAGGEPGGQRDPLARNGVPERALAGRECWRRAGGRRPAVRGRAVLPSGDPAAAKSVAVRSPRACISTAGTLDRRP
jgi:hypothetical protein